MTAKGSLLIGGLGDDPLRTATLEALVALASCEELYCEPAARAALRRLCPAKVSPGGAAAAFRRAKAGARVGLAVAGQPWRAGTVSGALLRRCAAAKVALTLVTGPSKAGLRLADRGVALGIDITEAEV